MCLSSPYVVGPGCVIGGFNFERTHVKFSKFLGSIWIKVGECMAIVMY